MCWPQRTDPQEGDSPGAVLGFFLLGMLGWISLTVIPAALVWLLFGS